MSAGSILRVTPKRKRQNGRSDISRAQHGELAGLEEAVALPRPMR
jgi:hypothetical protein